MSPNSNFAPELASNWRFLSPGLPARNASVAGIGKLTLAQIPSTRRSADDVSGQSRHSQTHSVSPVVGEHLLALPPECGRERPHSDPCRGVSTCRRWESHLISILVAEGCFL